MTPSNAMRSWNASATLRPPGRSSRRARAARSCGFASSRTRASSSISSSSICRRPAVSTITVSRPSSRARARPLRVASTASCVSVRNTGTWICCAELLELVDRGRTLQVGGDSPGLRPWPRRCSASFAAVVVLPEPCRPASRIDRELPEREPGLALAHQSRELVVDDLHDLLARRQALEDLLAKRLLADPSDEVADDGEVDIGLEQREADLAHRARDRLLVELSLLPKVAEGALQLVGQAVEHDRRMVAAIGRRALRSAMPYQPQKSLRLDAVPPLRAERPEAARDLARALAQLRRRPPARDAARSCSAPSTSASRISTSRTTTGRRTGRRR